MKPLSDMSMLEWGLLAVIVVGAVIWWLRSRKKP